MTLPLTGLTVVACEQAVAAPLATRHLADLGARVIKVERPPHGDFARDYDGTVLGQSSHFIWLNRSKESLTLNLKHPAAAQIMYRLLATADVFIQNLAPGAADRLGLGATALLNADPRLVVCNVSGYGGDGPYREAKAYDMLVQAEAGLLSITGIGDERARAGIPVADIGAGMYAYGAIVTALYERERTGRGGVVEVNLFDTLVEWMGFPLYHTRYSGTPLPRIGTHHAAIAPYGSFRAGDGEEVMFSIQNHREWLDFTASVLERPELATDPRFKTGPDRVRHRDELHRELDAVFAALSGAELVRRLRLAGIAHARARDVGDVWDHPQVIGRRLSDVDTPQGSVAAFLPPIGLPGRVPRMDPVPALGAHTDSVLLELGFTEDEVAGFRGNGVV